VLPLCEFRAFQLHAFGQLKVRPGNSSYQQTATFSTGLKQQSTTYETSLIFIKPMTELPLEVRSSGEAQTVLF
jgi:hypothetical protein